MKAGTIEIELQANMVRLQKDMDDAKRTVGGAMGAIERSVDSAKAAFGGLAGLVAGVSVGAFAAWVKGAIDAADNLNDLSKSTSLTVENLSGLSWAAKLSGTDLETVAKAVNKLSVEMGKDADKFARIGVTAKDPIEALKQLSDVFVAIEDPQQRAAFGAAALGKQWETVAPLLAEGGAKIGEMVEKGKQLSGITQESAEEAAKLNDQLDELKASADGFANKLASDMLPGMNNAVIAIKQAYEESGKLNALWTSMGALGAFLFTDEFSSVAVKIKNLEKEIQSLEATKKNYVGPSFLQQILIGSDEEINAKIASAKTQIEALRKSVEKPAPKQPTWTSGTDLPAGVAGFIDGGEAAKKAAEATKKALEERKKLLEEIAKADLAAAEAHTKHYESLAEGLKRLQEDTQAQKDYNDRLGLSREAIAALDAAKLEEQATTLEGIAIKRLDKDLDEGVYNLYKAQAEELRKLAKLKKEGADKETAVEEEKKALEEAQKIRDNFIENAQRHLGDGIYDALTGRIGDIGERFKKMFMRMAADAAAAKIMEALFGGKGAAGGGGLLGSLLDAGLSYFGGMGGAGPSSVVGGVPWTSGFDLPGFANGGNPPVGSPYWVGERGPEIRIDRTPGTIIPNHKIAALGVDDGKSGDVSIAVHVDASGSQIEGDGPKANDLGQMIGNAVRVVLVQEMRPGGLLAA